MTDELVPSTVDWTEVAAATGRDGFEGFWSAREVPADDGTAWVYAEPHAVTSFDGDAVTISAERFERSHDSVQRFDNPKHLVTSNHPFELRPGGLWLGVDIAGVKHGGGDDDVRDGFASFNVVDYETGLIFDIVTTSTRVAAIWERHPRPGQYAFTNVVEAPLHTPVTEPGDWIPVAVRIDTDRGIVQYFVDDHVFFESPRLPVQPMSVRVAIGLFTLRPIIGGRSRSLRGQGMTGRWRRLRFAYEAS